MFFSKKIRHFSLVFQFREIKRFLIAIFRALLYNMSDFFQGRSFEWKKQPKKKDF